MKCWTLLKGTARSWSWWVLAQTRMSAEGMAMGPGAIKGPPGAPRAPGTSGKKAGGPKAPPGGIGGGDGMQMGKPQAAPDLSKAVKVPEKYSNSRRRT